MEKEALQNYINSIWPILDERQRRLVAAGQASLIGRGGVTLVSEVCGLSRMTVTKGMKELKEGPQKAGPVRRSGAGRPSLTKKDPTLLNSLVDILESTTRGDPESPLRWTIKSTRTIAKELEELGHQISHFRVGKLMREIGYSLQSNSKKLEGKQHPDRNEQFQYINNMVKKALKDGQPVLSIDTKKKELIGNYKNAGQQWRKSDDPVIVNGHDFPDPNVPKAIPYGCYDFGRNTGFVNVGTDHDTATFAVASIRGWWKFEGKKHYKDLKYILITADSGGSNGYRCRLWKLEIYILALELGVPIVVCHFPVGTSKWNKIEHRLFSFISSNWRGQPLQDYETIVNMISHTTTNTGLKVVCRLDHNKYPTGRKVSDEEFEIIKITPAKFHGEWNYTLNL
jgi:transposase